MKEPLLILGVLTYCLTVAHRFESGVKQFKQRLTGAGMRWNTRNADLMLTIRAAA